MTYRNIFVYGPSLALRGSVDVCYTGRVYYDANHLKDFSSMYDRRLDMLVSCPACARNKYRAFVKVAK